MVSRKTQSSVASRRAVLRRIIRLRAELANRLIFEVQTTRKKKWVRDWIGKREKLGAFALLMK